MFVELPIIILIVVIVIGFLVLVAGASQTSGLGIVMLGLAIMILGGAAFANMPMFGPYVEDPENGNIYISEGTINLTGGHFATGLVIWNPSTKSVVAGSEILYKTKEYPDFAAGDCVSLQDKKMQKLNIADCKKS